MGVENLFAQEREVASVALVVGNPSVVEEPLVRAVVIVEQLLVQQEETGLAALEVENPSVEEKVLVGAV